MGSKWLFRNPALSVLPVPLGFLKVWRERQHFSTPASRELASISSHIVLEAKNHLNIFLQQVLSKSPFTDRTPISNVCLALLLLEVITKSPVFVRKPTIENVFRNREIFPCGSNDSLKCSMSSVHHQPRCGYTPLPLAAQACHGSSVIANTLENILLLFIHCIYNLYPRPELPVTYSSHFCLFLLTIHDFSQMWSNYFDKCLSLYLWIPAFSWIHRITEQFDLERT